MAGTKGALALASYDDIFSVKETTTPANTEAIIEIPLGRLHPPEFHPFQVRNDEAMKKTTALKHRGIVVDGIDIGTLSVTIVSKQAGESKSQIYRIIRLTELVPGLIDLVDAKKIAFNPAVELSYLNRKEQSGLLDAMAKYEATPSLPQAQRLKKHSQSGELTLEMIDSILAEVKKEPGSRYAV